MVECELKKLNEAKRKGEVLIDTWWNVNKYDADGKPKLYDVLIDTWWNVNVIIKPGEVRAFTF